MQQSYLDELDTWLRYLQPTLDKQMIDVSALQKVTTLVLEHEELQESFVTRLLELMTTEREPEATTALHLINAVVTNCRLAAHDAADAAFLAKLLDAGTDLMESYLSRRWRDWEDQLGRTLAEWHFYYKIENRLSLKLDRLLHAKGRETPQVRNEHFTLFQDTDRLAEYLQTDNTEAISTSLLRVIEAAFMNPKTDRGPYGHLLCAFSRTEAWRILMELTHKYVAAVLLQNSTQLFKNTGTNKLVLIPHKFVLMHSAAFVEASVGPSVRELVTLVRTQEVTTLVKSSAYQNCLRNMFISVRQAIEHLHLLSPFLAKYLCEVHAQITALRHSPSAWNELGELVIQRVLVPAVTNPRLAGVVAPLDLHVLRFLQSVGQLVTQAWLGKSVTGTADWINAEIPYWSQRLKAAFQAMHFTKKKEPKDLVFPKTLLLSDLNRLRRKMKQYTWLKCPFPPMSRVVLPHSEDVASEPVTTQEFEESADSNDKPLSAAIETQTETLKNKSLATQTESCTDSTQLLQQLEEAKAALERSRKQHQEDSLRQMQLSNYWCAQFEEAQALNQKHAAEIKKLKQQVRLRPLPVSKPVPLATSSQPRARQSPLLKHCDPAYYLGLEDLNHSRFSTPTSSESRRDQDFHRRVHDILQNVPR